MREVRVPEEVLRNENAVEILRVWAEPDGPQRFAISGPVWKDPAGWGLLFADIARFVSSVYADEDGLPPNSTLERIVAGLKAELE